MLFAARILATDDPYGCPEIGRHRRAMFFTGVNDAATASRLLLSNARPSLTRSIEKTLDRVRALGPGRVIELVDDRSAHRISVEDQTGNPSSDQVLA